MKITLNIPDSTVRSFRLLGAIMGKEWRTLLAEDVCRMEFIPDSPAAIAHEAVERAQTPEEAQHYARRAASLLPGIASEERLFLSWQEFHGEISPEEYQVLLDACRILEAPPA